MKKQLFIIAGLFLLCSCGGQNAEKMREDSIRRADSLAAAEATAEQERLEAMQRDSIVAANAGQKYDNAISITPGKKNKKHVPESSFYSIQWPCTITNNTDITLSPDDYQISFVETYEGQDKYGDFVDKMQRARFKDQNWHRELQPRWY